MISVPDTNPLVSAIALAITDARIALRGSPSSPAFNPDSLFGGGDGGGVIDIGRLNTLFQDEAGTVPVTAIGQVVRSIRARNRPTFLMALDPDNLEATYELDPQGFPALKAAPSASRGWAYYLKGDGGLPLTDWSIIMTSLGTYGTGLNSGVGTGWSLFGDSDGTYGTPYEYAGLYTVQPAGDRAEIRSTLGEGTQTFPVVENIDGRPYVYSTRSAAGDVDYQVNLEPSIETPNGAALYPAPVGIKFWISPDDYWYGGVFITRYLNETDNLQTQIWCGGLAGITLAPVVPFTPADIFAPTDPGVWYQYYLTPEQQVWRRNLYEQTESLDNLVSWGCQSLSVVPSAVLAPDGTATAWSLVGGTEAQQQALLSNIGPRTGLQSQYIYAKADTLPRISLTSFDGSSYVLKTLFDLVSGTIVQNTEGVATITDEGDGWWLCKVEGFNMTGISGGNMYQFRPARATDTDGQTSGPFLPGANTVTIWHPQREMGAVATTYQPITTPTQSFRNAFPDAHLWTDNTCKFPVFSLNQPIFCCVDQSQPYTQVPGAWTKTSGDATVTIVGDTITVTGGTTNTALDHPNSIIGSNTWCEIEAITGDFTVVTAWIGGQPENLLNGKNVFGGRNPGTGVNSIVFPTGQDYVFKISPLMNSNANTWQATGAAARPLYGLIGAGPAVGAIGDGIDDSGSSPAFAMPNTASIFTGLLNIGPDGTFECIVELSGQWEPGLWITSSLYQIRERANEYTSQVLADSKAIFSCEFTPDNQPAAKLNGQALPLSVNALGPPTPIGLSQVQTFNRVTGGTTLSGAITDVVSIGRVLTPLETMKTEDFINDNLGAF